MMAFGQGPSIRRRWLRLSCHLKLTNRVLTRLSPDCRQVSGDRIVKVIRPFATIEAKARRRGLNLGDDMSEVRLRKTTPAQHNLDTCDPGVTNINYTAIVVHPDHLMILAHLAFGYAANAIHTNPKHDRVGWRRIPRNYRFNRSEQRKTSQELA